MSAAVECEKTHSTYCCWPIAAPAFVCDRMRKLQNSVAEEGGQVAEKVPELFHFYCCFCCYRKSKSIGVVQENNKPTCNGTPIIPITIAPDVTKPQQSHYPSGTTSSKDRGLNTLITNEQQPENADDNDILFSKSAITLDRVASCKSNENELEETESFKQIDSIHQSRESIKNTSKETTPIRSTDGSNDTSVALPNSIDDNFDKTPTLSTKSAQSESAQVIPHPQSRPESVESHPVSVTSRPHSGQSQKQSVAAESRPESVVSSSRANLDKGVGPSHTTSTRDEVRPESETVFVDEVDKPVEILSGQEQLTVEDIQGSPTLCVLEEAIPDARAETPAVAETLSQENEILADSNKVENEEPHKPEESAAPSTTSKPTTPTATTPLVDIFESPLPIRSTSTPFLDQEYTNSSKPSTGKNTPHRNVSIESIPSTRHSSVGKSNDSLFEPSRKLEIDSKSTGSTTSSDYPPSHATSLDEPLRAKSHAITKSSHLPLIRKSKTTLFGRNRRVSPVKQSIKLAQMEVFPQTLTKFDKPKDALYQALMNLDSTEWETVIQGLRELVRMMRHHPEVLDTQMHTVCIQLGKAVRNLRSQVSRAACQAATELFTIRTKFLEQESDDLAGNLLHRTADTNRFLRADAMRALESMCDNLTPVKIIHVLSTRGAAHQNATVRTATAKLLNRLVDRLGYDRIFTLNREHRDKMLVMSANLLMEGSLETRSYTKALFRSLSEYVHCGKILKEVIPISTYRNIEKTLKSIL